LKKKQKKRIFERNLFQKRIISSGDFFFFILPVSDFLAFLTSLMKKKNNFIIFEKSWNFPFYNFSQSEEKKICHHPDPQE